MELPRTGGCQCGGVRYEITQAPVMVYTCHCTDCQVLTGSVFPVTIPTVAGTFRLLIGTPTAYLKTTARQR